jgi:hypothetical protein
MRFSRIFLKWNENTLGISLTNVPVAGTGKFGGMDLSAPFFRVSVPQFGSNDTGALPVDVL